MTSAATPPRWAEAILESLLAPAVRESVTGDLLEEYRTVIAPAQHRCRPFLVCAPGCGIRMARPVGVGGALRAAVLRPFGVRRAHSNRSVPHARADNGLVAGCALGGRRNCGRLAHADVPLGPACRRHDEHHGRSALQRRHADVVRRVRAGAGQPAARDNGADGPRRRDPADALRVRSSRHRSRRFSGRGEWSRATPSPSSGRRRCCRSAP